jgi:hypothetical protein
MGTRQLGILFAHQVPKKHISVKTAQKIDFKKTSLFMHFFLSKQDQKQILITAKTTK